MRIELIGLPYVKFSGKIKFPDGGELYISYGTEDMQTKTYGVEIPGDRREVTGDDVLQAFEKISDQVEELMLRRLGALCDKARKAVTSKVTIGLTEKKPQL